MLKSEILKELEKNKGVAVSGGKLAEALGVSRTAVWKAINSLKADGFDIKNMQSVGYYLPKNSDKLSVEGILNYVHHNIKILLFDELPSTNTKAISIATETTDPLAVQNASADDSANNPVAIVVIAEKQTAGKGRLGRTFYSPKDTGIYMSIIIRPHLNVEKSLLITTAASLAVAQAIKEICDLDAQIKWVNDVYINEKKVCGILTEAVTDFESGQISSLIVGIGINCRPASNNQDNKITISTKTDRTDLQTLANKIGYLSSANFERNVLIASVCDHLLDIVDALKADDCSFLEDYKKHSMIIGKDIYVYPSPNTAPDKKIPARAIDIDSHGGLVVKYEDNTITTLSTGEVSIRLATLPADSDNREENI